MGWFFRRKLECTYCGAKLARPKSGVMTLDEAGQMAIQVGYYCKKCRKTACSMCSYKEAQAAGKTYFICPQCRADICESYAR